MTGEGKSNITEAELLVRLSELPRRVAPSNDPWPSIEGRIRDIESRRRSVPARWMKVAASVAVAFAVGLYLGNSLEQSGTDNSMASSAQSMTNPASAGPVLGFHGTLAGAEREYQAAFSEFVAVARAGTEISPETIERLDNDWQEILEAETALKTALEQYPENALLNRQMLELRERQLGLLKQLAGLDRASRRTEI